jgi:hypothetical protein
MACHRKVKPNFDQIIFDRKHYERDAMEENKFLVSSKPVKPVE